MSKGFRGLIEDLAILVVLVSTVVFLKVNYFHEKKTTIAPAEEQLKKYFPKDTSETQRIHHWEKKSETYRFGKLK